MLGLRSPLLSRCRPGPSLSVPFSLSLSLCLRYIENLQRFAKLSYRIAFPLELKLTNVCEEAVDPNRTYQLFAVIVHAGSGPNHGHYVALVRVHNQWLCFDDDVIEPIEEAQIESYFGAAAETAASTETGYLLLYQAE